MSFCKRGHTGELGRNGSRQCVECARILQAAHKRTEKGRKTHRAGQKRYRRTEKGKQTARRANGLPEPKWPCGAECELCGIEAVFVERGLRLDHNHVTGEFRGWLCNACNLGLGKFKDSAVLLRKAADYLDGAP
ncbi:MAG: hypothetical protein KGL39_07035 [Patescibacteria group bacterium]|nr:hypothetical protein [Patescibacteria group bacterium]